MSKVFLQASINVNTNEIFHGFLKEKMGLEENQIQKLSKNLKSVLVKKGEFLLRAGDICQHTFFVEKGILRSFSIDDNGKEHIIQFAPETWIISDRSSTYFNLPSDFFVDAIEDTMVIFLDENFINEAANMSEIFRQKNQKALHNHIRFMQKRIDLLLGANAEKKYLEFIKLYPELTLRVPQWMIASYLGITPESLSRVRKELARRNFR